MTLDTLIYNLFVDKKQLFLKTFGVFVYHFISLQHQIWSPGVAFWPCNDLVIVFLAFITLKAKKTM